MTNKTCMSLAKQKVSFVFHSAEGLQRKTEFFAYVISGEWSANQQKQSKNDAFHAKT